MHSWSVAPRAGRPKLAARRVRRGRAGSVVNCAMETFQERPRFGRRPFRTRVTLSLPTSEAPVKANTLDISRGGVGLICSEPVPVGELALLTFHIRTRTGVQIEQVSGRVAQARMDDDVWLVGLEFTEVLDRQRTPLLARAAARRDTQP
jgi:hypothetical protein